MRQAWIPLLSFLAAGACTTDPATRSPAPDGSGLPDQILILVNGLRADLGTERVAAKAVGSVLQRAPFAFFENAYVQSTHPSLGLGSILTGRYVSAIPMCSPPDRTRDLAATAWCTTIAPDVPTLPEVLGLYGYKSLLAADQDLIINALGDNFDAAFRPEPETSDQLRIRTTWTTTERDRVLGWWTANAASPRLAVLVWSILDISVSGRVNIALQSAGPQANAQEIRKAAYDSLVQETVADLLNVLPTMAPEAGYPRPWSLVITSTHGMSLSEQGGAPDSQTVRITSEHLVDRNVHVPLFVYTPEQVETPTIGKATVQLIDLMPTMLARSGATLPAGLVGTDLATRLNEPALTGFGYAEWGDMLILRSGPWFYQARNYHHGGTSLEPLLTKGLVEGGDHASLFNLDTDPRQQHDVVASEPAAAASLRRTMIELRTGPAAPRVPNEIWTSQAMQEVQSEGYW